jgi:hypothetical protein
VQDLERRGREDRREEMIAAERIARRRAVREAEIPVDDAEEIAR